MNAYTYVLKQAKDMLARSAREIDETSKYTHICYAIHSAATSEWKKKIDGESICDAADHLCDIIADRLGYDSRFACPHDVTTWLYVNGHIGKGFSLVMPLRAERKLTTQIQLYRHRWVDALIKEFS